mmetsp:Transcript_15026/g.43403  ORF Transcript_15026/g.43403 Transcript_15026/m.43403 type:complete len:109 (+) Transcript_15026:24-350(+)
MNSTDISNRIESNEVISFGLLDIKEWCVLASSSYIHNLLPIAEKDLTWLVGALTDRGHNWQEGGVSGKCPLVLFYGNGRDYPMNNGWCVCENIFMTQYLRFFSRYIDP